MAEIGWGRLEALMRSDPVKAQKLLRQMRSKILVPHGGGQREVMDSGARFKVLNAGRRWGKTKIGVKSMLEAARAEPDRLVWWVAPTYKIVKRGYRNTLMQLPREMLTHEPPQETNFDAGRSVILKLKNGTTIEFYSAERPSGMLGEGVHYVVLDEAATMPSTVWEQIVRPTLADTMGHGMLISTPRGRNWFYRRWLMGQDGMEKEWGSWTFPSWTNPTLAASEIEAMRQELPLRLFEQEVEAKFLASGSSVFVWEPSQVERRLPLDNGLIEGQKVSRHVFLGIDLAKTIDYTVLYGANEDNMRNVFYDRFNSVRWSEQKRRIRRAVSSLMKEGAESVTLVMDATGVGDPIVEEMEDAGYDVIGINFTNTKAKMVSRFAKDLEKGRALILEEDSVEFENYAMDMTPKGVITYSAPEGEHDDVVSAKVLQHWGMMTEGSPDITTLSANEDPRNPRDERERDEDDFPEDDYHDWVDEVEEGSSGSEEQVAELQKLLRPPSPEELLRNPNAWV